MTRKEFVDLFLSKTAETVFLELYASWVSRNTSSLEKAERFERVLSLPVTLEWLREYGHQIHASTSRLLIAKEDPAYVYDPEVTGQRARILAHLTGLFTTAVNQARGFLGVDTLRISALPTCRFPERVNEIDYQHSNGLQPLTLADRSDTGIDDPQNTALIIGVNSIVHTTTDTLKDCLFRLNYRVLARIAVSDPVDPVALQSCIDKYQAKLLVLRYTGGLASPMHQVRAVLKQMSRYTLAKRNIGGGEPLLVFRLQEEPVAK
jgi:hypothetical protein